ncbi:MAG: EAL domain-containing protein [Rhodococcus sp. (in: high G+C Gram-positive bacteria)]|uniref:sensor domain-containing phosphodiesterase n=1 Tax=Rhodococcus sp. EPR-157 TaxID=1813677 RepID=UPI0007BC5250|nr:EAL domain-containing protein [Rhodococcus sp. EPR-157]KZF07021.1 hypothetical protein A2J03_23510 [Rhodococcus sp. EPR-157]
MFRSPDERQSESARKYLDYSAVSPALENAAAVTARALDFPVALVNILDDRNQYTLVSYGVDDAGMHVVPLSESACRAVVDSGRPIVVQDVDQGVASYSSTTTPTARPTAALIAALNNSGLCAYASIPLFGRESVPIGTLCVLDFRPRQVSADDFHLLEQLAVMVEEHLDAQRNRARITNAEATVREVTRALDAGHITPWYQPIVDLRSGELFALEALARWEHPTLGVRPPSDFIGRMENTDLIIDLDLRILTRALEDFRKWTRNHPNLRLSVNISGHHLERLNCIDRITCAVRASGLDAKSLILEITETARGVAVGDEARIVAALRAAGFTVMLDDLGSGWSPVPRLTQVSVDGFKLDRSVAASLHTKVGNAVAVAMLQFATELDHNVVLEGIENKSRLDRGRALGFTHGQGYWFSKALAADAVPGFLESYAPK